MDVADAVGAHAFASGYDWVHHERKLKKNQSNTVERAVLTATRLAQSTDAGGPQSPSRHPWLLTESFGCSRAGLELFIPEIPDGPHIFRPLSYFLLKLRSVAFWAEYLLIPSAAGCMLANISCLILNYGGLQSESWS